MIAQSLSYFSCIAICSLAPNAHAEGYSRAGAKAELETFFHGVRGTATILDSNAVQVTNFDYDGKGITVFFYLGTNRTSQAFQGGIYFTNLLTGPVYSNATVTVTLPGTQSLDGYNAISVWCQDVSIDFGSGTFQPIVDSIAHSNGVTSMSIAGAAAQVYQLQGSTNGVDWNDLGVMTNWTGTVSFTDTNALSSRLYRAEVQ